MSVKRRKTESSNQAMLDPSAFSSSSRPRPSSPSRTAQARNAERMGPPTGFVRKTRKSMRAMGFDMEDGSLDSVVPIPESETPMIRKNKELREAQQRRSSLGLRGQRASTSLGKGEISEWTSTFFWASSYPQAFLILPSMPDCFIPTSARKCLSQSEPDI